MSRAVGDRHRRWGVTAAFVLQVPALRRFCGLVESAVSPEECGGWDAQGMTPPPPPPPPPSDDTEEDVSTQEYPVARISPPLRETRREEDCSSTGEAADSSVAAGEEATESNGRTVRVVETSVLVERALGKASACPNSGEHVAQNARTEDDKAGDDAVQHLTSCIHYFKTVAHDSAIDSTGLFDEVNDSDSCDDGSEASCARLKRSTSQESVESLSSSVSAESWGMVIRNLNIRRSVSSDSIGSELSSETDSALSTSEDERSEDSDNDRRFSEDSGAGNKDELYAVDDRHAELLGIIRWTCFEELLKVLRFHAEDEGYASAAGPGKCVAQTVESETSDIIQQAFLAAMTASSAEDDLESLDVKSTTSEMPTWSGSAPAVSTQPLADLHSNHDNSVPGLLQSPVSEEANHGGATLCRSFPSEYFTRQSFGDVDLMNAEPSHFASSSISDTDSSDSENDDTETDSLLEDDIVKNNINNNNKNNNNNNNNSVIVTQQRRFGCFVDVKEETEQDHESADCKAVPGSDRRQAYSPIAKLQTGLGIFSHCPPAQTPLSSSPTRTLDSSVSDQVCEAQTETASVSANSSPAASSEASCLAPPSGMRCLGLSFSSDHSDDSRSERSPTSVHRRRHLMTGYTSPSNLPSSGVVLGSSFLEGGAVFFSSRSSFDDSNRSGLTLSPGVSQSSQWPFSDAVFTTPLSSRATAVIDESAEASRWLEEHSADSSTYSPFLVYGGRSSPPVPIGRCLRHPETKPHLSLSEQLRLREQTMTKTTAAPRPQQESSSQGARFFFGDVKLP